MTLKNEKKILVLGGEGLLGTSLAQFPWPKDYRLISLSHSDLDITDSNILNSCLSSIKPDYIINASVYGKGEGADAKKSYLTNTLALYSLSTYCKENNVLLVHYSTDYVFDGYQKTPYKECDKKNPLNIYGNSKYAGELIIESIAPPHFIIRSSWLFDVQGKNFVKWIYEQSKISQKLNIIDDQIGCPTYALDIVHATVHIINNYKNKNLIERNRTYHLTGKEPTSWYLYAKDILNIIKKKVLIKYI